MAAPTKKRSAPRSLPNKSHKSQERVVDSADEETVEETATTTTTTTTTTETESESETETETETDSQTPAPKSPPKSASYAYTPPPQFSLVPPSTDTRSNPFSARNLAGKELWLIAAPLAAPLSKLGVLNLADVAAGAPMLQTGSGRQYCMRAQDAEDLDVAVHDGHGGYCVAGKRIVRSFQVVETLPTPATAVPDSGPRKVRAQPDGLWMRFKPIGYVGAQDEDANVQAGEVEVEVRGHGGGEHKKKKRRREDGERAEKKKKHRRKSAVAS